MTLFCNILCNIGFVVSYLCLFKDTFPVLLIEIFGIEKVPKSFGNNFLGKITCLTLFMFIILLISLPRKL